MDSAEGSTTHTLCLLISRKINKPHHPPLYFNNSQIIEVQHHKHLGLTLSNSGTWNEHINYVKDKAWSRINIMRKFKFKLNRKALEAMYFSFIRPILEYADVVWDNCTKTQEQDLEKIHIEAAKIITGTTKLVSIDKLYIETGWETLKVRRFKHRLT